MPDSNVSDHDLLIRIDTKLTALLRTVADHEKRLRHGERLAWRLSGAAATLGAALGAGGARLLGH